MNDLEGAPLNKPFYNGSAPMQTILSFDALTASQRAFVCRVSGDLNANRDAAQVAVYGDGSRSSNGEKFAATRLGNSWEVVFDFGTGCNYHTAVQLPIDWHLPS